MTKLKSKRLLSLILSLAMVFTLTAAPVFAADDGTDATGTSVASIGNTTYETLADAFAAASTGDTITLKQDVTVDESSKSDNGLYQVSGDVTLDLNDKTLTITNKRVFGVLSGSLTIKDGTIAYIASGDTTLAITRAGASFSAEDVEFKAASTDDGITTTSQYLVYAAAGGSVALTDCTISNVSNAVVMDSANSATVYIKSCDFGSVTAVSGSNYSGYEIYIDIDSTNNIIGDVVKVEGGYIYTVATDGSITASSTLYVKDCGTLIVDGGSLSGSIVIRDGGWLDVKSGTVSSDITVEAGGKLTVSGGTVSGKIINSGYTSITGGSVEAITLKGTDTATASEEDEPDYTVSVSGGTVSGAVTIAGGATLNLSDGGTITSTVTTAGTFNMTGGTVTVSGLDSNNGAVHATAGTVTISDGMITATGDKARGLTFAEATFTGSTVSGGTISGSNLALLTQAGTSGVTVTGGTFITSESGMASIIDRAGTVVGAYDTDGNAVTKDSNNCYSSSVGDYTVIVGTTFPYAAKIDTILYKTVGDAVDAAESGSQVTLMTDVTEDITIDSDDEITLDLAGHTVTGTGATSVITVNGVLTLTDSTATISTSDPGTVGTTNNGDGTYTTVYTETTYDSSNDSLTTTYYSYTSGAITGGTGSTYYNANQIGGGIYVTGTGVLTMEDGTVYGNTLSTNTNSRGAGIAVDEGSLTMTGGVVAGNTVTKNNSFGAGVYVLLGSFSMTGGAICNNAISVTGGSGGGLYLLNGNNGTDITYTIFGGVISGNTARAGAGMYVSNSTVALSDDAVISDNSIVTSGTGGGICLDSKSVLTMDGGTIANNTALASSSSCYGGGVCMKTSGSSIAFIMSDGVIAGNTAYTGGGVYIGSPDSGTNKFTMTGGTITGNSASGTNGGGVYVAYYADFTMESGSITGNTAKFSGGGVCIESDSCASFTMTGGTISENTAGTYGGGVMVNYYSVFTLGGSATITDNMVSSETGNVYLDDSKIILSGSLTGTVGVTTCSTPASGSPVQITVSESDDATTYYASSYSCFVSDSDYITCANTTDACVELAVGLYLGISTDTEDTTQIPAEIVFGEGESVMYVKVSGDYIGTDGYYSTGAYPTTFLTFTGDDSENHSYIFAGWYSSEDGEAFTACSDDMWDDTSDTATYYAKFVDDDVLTVRCVFTYDVSEYGNIWRFLTSIDSLSYDGVYFTISSGDEVVETTTATTKAYTSYTITGVSKTFSPTADFSSASGYVVTDYYADYDKNLTTCMVAASWITCDGTTVTGESSTFTHNSMTAVLSAK